MDPQVLAMLLSQAKGGNKNLSSLLGNLDNPNLLALAGVLDPYYGQGAGGTTYGQFASDPTTPAAVKAVMDYVDQGMNSYQIEAAINTLDDDVIKNSGYTDQQLISMGRDMAKEGGKKGSDVFSKAGLRNPNDVYNISDVPLNESIVKALLGQQTRRKMFDDKAATIKSNLYKTEKASRKTKTDLDDTVETIDASNMDYRFAAAAKRLAKKQAKKKGPDKNQPYLDYEYAQAKEDYEASVDAARSFDELEMATRRGALKRVAEKGQTPYTDQMSTLLKFVAGSK